MTTGEVAAEIRNIGAERGWFIPNIKPYEAVQFNTFGEIIISLMKFRKYKDLINDGIRVVEVGEWLLEIIHLELKDKIGNKAFPIKFEGSIIDAELILKK